MGIERKIADKTQKKILNADPPTFCMQYSSRYSVPNTCDQPYNSTEYLNLHINASFWLFAHCRMFLFHFSFNTASSTLVLKLDVETGYYSHLNCRTESNSIVGERNLVSSLSQFPFINFLPCWKCKFSFRPTAEVTPLFVW